MHWLTAWSCGSVLPRELLCISTSQAHQHSLSMQEGPLTLSELMFGLENRTLL